MKIYGGGGNIEMWWGQKDKMSYMMLNSLLFHKIKAEK